MSARFANSAAPTYAATMWVDHVNIYMEIPAVDNGPPYIVTYALSEGGLSKALRMMHELYVKDQPIGGNYKIPLNPLVRKTAINNFTQDQRDAARVILRKLGIV